MLHEILETVKFKRILQSTTEQIPWFPEEERSLFYFDFGLEGFRESVRFSAVEC